jgi:hypothetical protein
LRPQLQVRPALHLYEQQNGGSHPEAIGDLLRIEFDPAEHPPPTDVLAAWPQNTAQEIALFRTLNRAMLDALEEAEDVGLLEGWDVTGYDVPSVAKHPQNAYRSGFYPITRVLADLWERIAARNVDRARKLTEAWRDSAYLLVRRLALFTLAHDAFSPDEAALAIINLDEKTFWDTNAQVEVMRVLVRRWGQFTDANRFEIETRLRRGVPRELYPAGTFEEAEEWRFILDSSVYRRLKRLEQTGGALSKESLAVLTDISNRNPTWRPGTGDRDDFHVWHESRWGPAGEPDLLSEIADDRLVKEAMRLQRERQFEQGDVWRLFCSAAPERALRALEFEADRGEWPPEEWRCLIWAAFERGNAAFQFALAGMLLKMPDTSLRALVTAVPSWLQKRREMVSGLDGSGCACFLTLWDKIADLTYVGQDDGADVEEGNDLLTESLNRPGGILAWALLDALGALKRDRDSGLPPHLRPRFDRVATAPGRAGLLARVYLGHSLAYLDFIDPAWVEKHFLHRLSWEHPEAPALWRSFAHGRIGSARMFNALKPASLEAFERKVLSENELEGLVSKLLTVDISHRRGEAMDYNLTPAEIRRALAMGPSAARRNAAWNLWRMMAEVEGEPADKATRWRELVGPLFHDIWPLDARLRSKNSTRNLVLMALECEEAFPEAVEAILDVVVPYELYQVEHSLMLEDKHRDLAGRYPLAFVRLTSALVDPALFPVPTDLTEFLHDCLAANPAIAEDPAYVRLYNLRQWRDT